MKRLPWWFIVGAKLALSRLPIPYSAWRSIGLFLHGSMVHPTYAEGVVRKHFNRCFAEPPPSGFWALELGPGDSLFSALIAHTMGAGRTFLVDAGPCAVDDVARYHNMAKHLQRNGAEVTTLLGCRTLAEMLEACHATYLTRGLHSFASIPSSSLDWVWSHAVLEHLPTSVFAPFLRELHRVMKPTGVASHRVDLQDHLGHGLNHLRFPDALWEGPLFSGAGFYTNRIRFNEMRSMFEHHGFQCEILSIDRWDSLPTPRRAMIPRFRDLPEDDLRVRGFDVRLRPI